MKITDADREAVADWMQSLSDYQEIGAGGYGDLIQAFARHRIQARKEALEEAAKEADRFYQAYPRETASDVTAWEIAIAIRNLANEVV